MQQKIIGKNPGAHQQGTMFTYSGVSVYGRQCSYKNKWWESSFYEIVSKRLSGKKIKTNYKTEFMTWYLSCKKQENVSIYLCILVFSWRNSRRYKRNLKNSYLGWGRNGVDGAKGKKCDFSHFPFLDCSDFWNLRMEKVIHEKDSESYKALHVCKGHCYYHDCLLIIYYWQLVDQKIINQIPFSCMIYLTRKYSV